MSEFLKSTGFRAAAALVLMSVALVATSSQAVSSQGSVVYENSFEAMSAGPASDDDIGLAWDSRYAKGPDEGRVDIVAGGSNSRSGNAARVLYPAGGNQTARSGATWETGLGEGADELYLSYWVKFDSDFQFVKGGKLPGLAGMDAFPGGDNKFTARLMWREDGKIEFYLHGFNVNNSEGAEPYRVFWDDFGGHAQFTKGSWHHIEMRVKLNTPGRRDGLLEGWLDGELRVRDSDNSGVRAAGQEQTKINYIFFSTFFGGSSEPASQWQPTSDVYAHFDDFVVSTAPIGDDGTLPPVAPSVPVAPTVPVTTTIPDTTTPTVPDTESCSTYTGGRMELDLSTTNCVNVAEGLDGRTLQVWDSDAHTSCNFRGVVRTTGGDSSLTVLRNYEAAVGFTGTQLIFEPDDGCRFVKMRLF